MDVKDLKIKYFFVGPTMQGTTTLCHFLCGNRLSIEEKIDDYEFDEETNRKKKFVITADGHRSDDLRIGNCEESATLNPIYYGKQYCDFSGINEIGGNAVRLKTLVKYQKIIQKTDKFKLILVFDEDFILSNKSVNFSNSCREIMRIFNLDSSCVNGIHLVVTNSSEKFVNQLPDILRRRFRENSNFIIDYIKDNKNHRPLDMLSKISSFDKPVLHENNKYMFSEENKQKIIKNIEATDFLWRWRFKFNILPKIYELANLVLNSQENHDIIFLSKAITANQINENIIITSKDILIIDVDIKLEGKTLEIDSPTIIVQTGGSEKRFITLEGSNPIIKFTERVKSVINDESLVLMTSNISRNQEFLDPTTDEFDQSKKYIRLESICINGWWNENVSYSNTFIDLIVHFDRNYGSIKVDNKWKIKTVDCNINMKLHLNECMRTKNGVTKNFKSLRRYKDVKTYLKEMNKNTYNQEDISFFEKYIVNLPSIFQIFMKNSLFQQLLNNKKEIADLKEIRKIFIERYLNIVKDFNSNSKNCSIEKTDINRKSHEITICSIQRICRPKNILNDDISNLSNTINETLWNGLNYQNSYDLLKFYHVLSLTKDKVSLFNYGITGDLSIYPNFEAMIEEVRAGDIIIPDQDMNLLILGRVIGVFGLIAALIGFGLRKAALGAIGTIISPGNFLVSILRLGEVGYCKGMIKVQGKDIRYDCCI
ncbi:hypothetical protein SteCoe_323 [Stentor coeruleus]|uniref:Uncharacterized protein n=1 Tax=Stentor coeruleus TaxID=5963 RepID=A0A1R2D4F7_9CILI|nr:hypothetical protein SteCoe_323 [Stentor coeruleus]